MKKRNPSQNLKSTGRVKQSGAASWRFKFLIVTCGLLIACGLFYAARQHFSAMDYGIKNAKLRQQKDELEAERRRLSLARDVALSPDEIKKSFKKVGLREYAASGIETVTRNVKNLNPFDEKKSTDTTKKAFLPKETAAVKETAKPEKEAKTEIKAKPATVTAGDVRQRIAKK